MPIYIYTCKKCNRTMEVCQKITDPILIKHSDMTEGHIGLKDICNGDVKKTIQTPSIHFKGLGWTPKHFK